MNQVSGIQGLMIYTMLSLPVPVTNIKNNNAVPMVVYSTLRSHYKLTMLYNGYRAPNRPTPEPLRRKTDMRRGMEIPPHGIPRLIP